MSASDHRRARGRLGEELACHALTERGYEIVARNWRCPQGEIDIVARDGECLVFVEVKTRRGRGAGLPEDGLTVQKTERLLALAQRFIAEREWHELSWRLDLVAIELDRHGAVARLSVIPGVGVD
ncbi:MAG: YraN family protein [Chloroflexi bacterium]|nr:YraN family protein [Chloroflexota bacterium]